MIMRKDFYIDLYQFGILNICNSTDFYFFFLEICKLDGMPLSSIGFLDSAFPNTPKNDLKPLFSHNASTFITKQLFCFYVVTSISLKIGSENTSLFFSVRK